VPVASEESAFRPQGFSAALTEPAGAAVVVEGTPQGFDTVVLFLEDGSILRVPALALWAVLTEQGFRRLGQVFAGMIEGHPFLAAVESLVVVGIVPQDTVVLEESKSLQLFLNRVAVQALCRIAQDSKESF
jgi:hypothetical protein